MTIADNPTDRPEPGSSFELFYRTHYPSFARLAYLLAGDHARAEDLVQEAFIAVHGRFEGLENPAGYLRVTLINLVRRHHRGAQREERRLRLVNARPQHATLGANEILDALAALPREQRELIVLRFWAGFTEAEIAEATGCKPGTVKSRSARALARLRKDIKL